MATFLPAVGLCSICANVRVVQGNPPSVFYLCELAFRNPRFRKYPPLPVVRCEGFRHEVASELEDEEEEDAE